jgi:hypothetical protein
MKTPSYRLAKVKTYLALAVSLAGFSGCLATKTVGIEQPAGSRQFVEVTEDSKGHRTYNLIKCEPKERCFETYCEKYIECYEQAVSGSEEIDNQANSYWEWNK